MNKGYYILASILALLTNMMLGSISASAQNTSEQHLSALMPGEQDLQGFTRVRPAGEIHTPEAYSQSEHKWSHPLSPAAPTEDDVRLNVGASEWMPGRQSAPGRTDQISRIERNLYSLDGAFHLLVRVTTCASPAAASQELGNFRRGCSRFLVPGSLTGEAQMGDESWVPEQPRSDFIAFRYGRIMALVSGDRSSVASRQGMDSAFPVAALEAVAYQILLRESQQAHVNVNGHALPKGALMVGRQTYVPVREFARAMGLTSGWDTKTGALTLSGPKRKTVVLTAGSTAATVGGAKAAALAVPVLKDAGQPVMALSDLLALTGGRVTGRAGNTVRVGG